MQPLAARTGRISTSQTVAIDARYKELKAEGKDVLSLGAGEPDLDTPDFAKEAAVQSIRNGMTKYTAVTGMLGLKESVSRKFARDNGLAYPPSDIIVSSGAKHAVFNALLALVEDGDEVIIPTPCWVTYPEVVRFLGGKPVLVQTSYASGFKMTADQLGAAVTSKSKLLILNSPGNPTGAVYTEPELRSLADLAVKHDLYVLSDEIYEYIVYDGARHVSIASLGQEIFSRTITINGMSKAYAMTGWRIGYTGAPPHLAKAIASIQSHGTHHPANASQIAAQACLDSDGEFVRKMHKHLTECRDLALKRLAEIPGLRVLAPAGAFYAFFGIEAYFGKSYQGNHIRTSMELCQYLLDSQLLATVPGSAFGMEGFMRISFAASLETLDAALVRLQDGLSALK